MVGASNKPYSSLGPPLANDFLKRNLEIFGVYIFMKEF
jgi:hypothetical protein